MTLRIGDGAPAGAPGWTLMELIIAMTILVAGLAGIMVSLGRVLEGANQTALSAQAGLLAQRALGEMEVQGWAQGASREIPGAAGRFQWQTRIIPDEKTPMELWSSKVIWLVRGKERAFEISRFWFRSRSQSS
ncbi:MAG: hypothetical protein HY594_04700 [Candidatus Omnitrophica bacterium]|nr:hypothetical protein [Candidatus Omnitrophota bacterium]